MNKYNLKAHLIFVCKYRKKLLKTIDMKAILNQIACKSDFNIDLMEDDLDHIHMLISYPPTLSITQMVRRLKQQSTCMIWRTHNDILCKHFYKEHTFWSDGYFVSSIGDASLTTIKEYIRNQG